MSKFINIQQHYLKPSNIIHIDLVSFYHLHVIYYSPQGDQTKTTYDIHYDNLDDLLNDVNLIYEKSNCTFTGFRNSNNYLLYDITK
jgi:hypothetical protein